MLLIEAVLTRAAKIGANLSEVKKISERVVTLSNNQKEARPVWGSVYLDGLPLGESAPEIKAPLALETGDTLLVADLFPDRILYEVWRDGKLAWADKELHARESDRAARQSEKLDARTKAGI